jgi:predicted CXXCH cytochrome family protein
VTGVRCLIETVRRGQIPEARDLDTDCLSLGRGADQDIRVQSRLAGLKHAVIEQEKNGDLRIRAIAPNHILFNGRKLSEAVLTPGDEFSIGSVSLTVMEAPKTYDLRLEIKEQTGRQNKELENALWASINTDSERSIFSMRRTAWTLSLAVLLLFLLMPLAGFVYKPLGIWLRTLPVVSDLSWNSGTISAAHSFFAADCNRCHEQAFVPVRNSVCTDCHKDTPHHVAEEFRESIATLESNRCSSCHKEHNGSHSPALIRHDESLCTSCHKNIKSIAPDSELADVSDFGDGHPEFQATIATFADDKSQPVRISLEQKDRLQERASIEFSHAAHLNKEGIKNADNVNVQLECADCHQPEPGGKYMAKLDFESQCHGCHKLNFDADDPKLELPHGDDYRIQTFLDGYYADRAMKGDYRLLAAPPVARERHRPGEVLPPLENLERKEWVSKYVRNVDSEVMRFRVCGKCHTVSLNLDNSQEEEPQQFWKVEPLAFSAHKFPKADFNHDRHKTQECTDCHDAKKSEYSEDVLLKGIASCRECHAGAAGAENKVASTCIDCHGFHTSTSLTMDGKKIKVPPKAGTIAGIESPPAGNNVSPSSAVP